MLFKMSRSNLEKRIVYLSFTTSPSKLRLTAFKGLVVSLVKTEAKLDWFTKVIQVSTKKDYYYFINNGADELYVLCNSAAKTK